MLQLKIVTQPGSATPMHGDLCFPPVHSPVPYHSVVAVRYPDLRRIMGNLWELGSFASGGIPNDHQAISLYCGILRQKSTGLWQLTKHTSLACHCRLRRQHRLFQRPLCHDDSHWPQEQPQQIHHQKDLFPNASRGDHRQLGRRHYSSHGCTAQHRFS